MRTAVFTLNERFNLTVLDQMKPFDHLFDHIVNRIGGNDHWAGFGLYNQGLGLPAALQQHLGKNQPYRNKK